MRNKDFVVFILTHGRADNVITLDSLNKSGYTGEVYYIVDNEDKQQDLYIKNFGEKYVKIFDKQEYINKTDTGNNFGERRSIVYARNACFDIATELGYKYFIELDDDYTSFLYRYPVGGRTIRTIDVVFDAFIDFLEATNISSIAFSQGGDHIGGFTETKLKRKCMNSFICSTERPFKFVGAMNDDVNTYVTLASRGKIFFTFTSIQLNQMQTQTQAAGLTDMYLRYGTYCKSFTTVMMSPSSVKVNMLNTTNSRLHHSISWKNTTPYIISEKYKK